VKKTERIRLIKADRLIRLVTELARQANFEFPKPLVHLLDRAIVREESAEAKQALSAILTNIRLAQRLPLPLCQDTGLVEVFLEIGHRVRLDLGGGQDLETVINRGVSRAYREYYLRASAVDPLSRENTGDNTPAVVHTRIVAGRGLVIRMLIKGFGSENMGRIQALSPGASPEEIVEKVVQAVAEAGANPCPPVIIGCGLGGTMEQAALAAREALLEPEELLRPNPDRQLRAMEKEILRRVNRLGIGPAGMGGRTTALAARIEKRPTHIAGLPLAVNISCWALRTARAEI